MGIEHSCHVCGNALGRVRAAPEPHYGLPVVVCGVCQTACVRRRHPLSQTSRWVLGWIWAMWGMVWRLGVGAIAVLGAFTISAWVSETMRGVRAHDLVLHARGLERLIQIDDWKQEGPAVAMFAAAWFIAIGTIAQAGLGHLRRWQSWATMLGAMFLGAAVWVFFGAVARYVEQNFSGYFDVYVEEVWVRDWPALEYAALGMVVSLLGIVPGRFVGRAMRMRERLRWIARLRRARKARRQA